MEDAVLSIEPVPVIEVRVENREGVDSPKEIFKWFLDVVPKNTILHRAQARGILDVRFALTDRWQEWRRCDYVTVPEVLAECSVQTMEGGISNASEAFERIICRRIEE